jgi:hypothetical protein
MKINEILTEALVGELNFGPLKIMVDQHTIDRSIQRYVSPFGVDRVLKQLPSIIDELRKVEPGQQVWVYDQAQNIALGMRRLGTEQNLRFLFKTVVGDRPYDSDMPVILLGEPQAELDEQVLDELITPDHRAKIRQTMKSAGYAELGTGADAAVYAKDADTVIKILMPDSGQLSTGEKTFLDFYQYVTTSKPNPFLPRFVKIQGQHHNRFEIDGEPFRQIAMERLQPIPAGTALQGIVWIMSECAARQLSWQQVLDDFMTESDLWRYWSGDPDVPELVYNEFIDHNKQSYYEALYITMLILARLGAHKGWGWDLHTENVMQRADGTPVIIDPWYHDVLGTV